VTTYYKAVSLDGTSFHDPAFRWVPESGPVEGHEVLHRLAKTTQYVLPWSGADQYLSVSVEPADCTGMSWPLRLLEVEPVDGFPVETPRQTTLPNKRAAMAWRVVREVDATQALGPQGREVAALIERARSLTTEERDKLAASRDDPWAVAQTAAWDAAWGAARAAAWDAAWVAARYVAAGLLVRDLISREHYDTLTLPWRTAVGPIHPDDEERP